MILEGKNVLIMGIRNKWSIAWGAALSAYKAGAKNIIFTYNSESSGEKSKQLLEEIPNATLYQCDVSNDEAIKETFNKIKEKFGRIDCILHSIAHANTEDLRNDFIKTSREGFLHACEISAYSFVAVARIADEIDLLSDDASLVALSYYGAEKVLNGYNVMGIAKAALESSVRYLSSELGNKNIRVNAVSAGPIKTLSAKGIKDFNTILDVVEKRAPLKRNVTKEEVGDVVTFLFSDMSRCITGQIIYADNGYEIMGI